MRKILGSILLVICLSLSQGGKLYALGDTLRIMSYNVLYYGDSPACQSPHDSLHGYLKTIVAFTNPDVLGLVKVEAFPTYPGDRNGTGPNGWADSILRYALNAAFPARYAWCPVTNAANAGDVQVLFYDQTKLGYLGTVASYVRLNDFNTFKLYYKTPMLATGYDTVFLYVTLNHTESGAGTSNESIRLAQINGEMNQLQSLFSNLPNLVNLGDFNFHRSAEPAYQRLVNPSNTGFKLYDPLFGIDGVYSYPADWDSDPDTYARSLTTSTRLTNSPNSCGTTGGGKSWYDHIFLSGSIKDNRYGLHYISGSYSTVGNDGRRVGKNINDTPANAAAPASVINALFRMSNKYPVMASLMVTPAFSAVADVKEPAGNVTIENPVPGSTLSVWLPVTRPGSKWQLVYTDLSGKVCGTAQFQQGGRVSLPFAVPAGTYFLTVINDNETLQRHVIIKQ